METKFKNPAWLDTAVFYEIYPQSFLDTDGDGIGDLPGVIAKLDYVQSLNVSAIWLNPCFVSEFQDAGYDVVDYCRIAPRYGTNEDAAKLFAEAHRRGMKVVLDLVAGHTSLKHPWFLASERKEKPYDNYYCWTDGWKQPWGPYPFVRGKSSRDGYYLINYFYCQPALNYGFSPVDPDIPWQLPPHHPDCLKVREEMRNVMKFWLDMGCDGFRVDMAPSLIKGTDRKPGIRELWRDYRGWLDAHYPEAVLISEWGDPLTAVDSGFHVDFFFQDHTPGYSELFRAEPERLPNGSKPVTASSFFDRKGEGDASLFAETLMKYADALKGRGFFGVISGNHDIGRFRGNRDMEELFPMFAFLLMLPGVPFLYYGDEIGMDNVFNLGNVEGSYNRSAARTPMQWAPGEQAGFSTACPEKFYLPPDGRKDRPNVEESEKDPASLLNFVRGLLKLRKEHPVCGNTGGIDFPYCRKFGYPVLYHRTGEKEDLLVAVNPSGKRASAVFALAKPDEYAPEFVSDGVLLRGEPGQTVMEMPPVSYFVGLRKK